MDLLQIKEQICDAYHKCGSWAGRRQEIPDTRLISCLTCVRTIAKARERIPATKNISRRRKYDLS